MIHYLFTTEHKIKKILILYNNNNKSRYLDLRRLHMSLWLPFCKVLIDDRIIFSFFGILVFLQIFDLSQIGLNSRKIRYVNILKLP